MDRYSSPVLSLGCLHGHTTDMDLVAYKVNVFLSDLQDLTLPHACVGTKQDDVPEILTHEYICGQETQFVYLILGVPQHSTFRFLASSELGCMINQSIECTMVDNC